MRRVAGWLVIALLGAVSTAAGGDPRDAMAPDLFARYAKDRLRDLRAEVHAIGQIATKFEARCESSTEPKTRATSDCSVAKVAQEDLRRVIDEQRHIVERLVRQGYGDEAWLVAEQHEFWGEVHQVRR